MNAPQNDSAFDSVFLKACRGEPVSHTPIWLMRQAGRYLPEYRAIRETVGFLEFCKRPDLAGEITAVTVERLNVDAAIIFADILLIAEPLGFQLEFIEGKGPVIHNPIRSDKDVANLKRPTSAASLAYVGESIRVARRRLNSRLPLIGFAGAPFTVASYLIEGAGSRNHEKTKTFMRSEPKAFSRLMESLVDLTALYLAMQVEAGASALQVFDSWIGTLPPSDYRAAILPFMKQLFERLPKGIPLIYFGVGTAPLLESMKEAGPTVLGIDFHTSLSEARRHIGSYPLQGNLDPTVLLSPPAVIEREARRILAEGKEAGGHIFNLGHGILPTTPVEHARFLIDFVHSESRR